MHRSFSLRLLTAVLGVFCSSCGIVGDTGALKEANELAVSCRTEDALAAVDRAAARGGFSSYLAELERVVFLRDAGRTSEADAALAERNRRAEADAQDMAEADQAVAESVKELRDERERKLGKRLCR